MPAKDEAAGARDRDNFGVIERQGATGHRRDSRGRIETIRTYPSVPIGSIKMFSSDQLRAARALLGLSQQAVASAAGISTMTLKRAEGSGRPAASADSMEAIGRALEAAGVAFLSEGETADGGPGVRLRKEQD